MTLCSVAPGLHRKSQWLWGDRGYDVDGYRKALADEALADTGITPCIPGRKARKNPVRYDKRRCKRGNRIEVLFGHLKDRRRVATGYDRCPTVFLFALALAATDIFWLWR